MKKKCRLALLSILLLSFSFILIGCVQKLSGTYNSYSSSSNFSSSDALTTITFTGNTAEMTVQYYELAGIMYSSVAEKQITLEGSVNTKEKTITFKNEDNEPFTVNYELLNDKLTLDGKTFAVSTSSDYADNKNKFLEAKEQLSLETSQSSQEKTKTSSSVTTDSSTTLSKNVPNIAEKIIKDLSQKIVGTWKSGSFDTAWHDGSRLTFNEDGTFSITEIMPEPDYLSYNLTYTGTYEFDKNALVTLLEEGATSTFGTPLELNKIYSYEDYQTQMNGRSSFIPVILTYEKSGIIGDSSVHESLTKTIDIEFKNNSISLSTIDLFYKFNSSPQYIRE